jgi:hypothetical protein
MRSRTEERPGRSAVEQTSRAAAERLTDNRPEAVTQRELADRIRNSPMMVAQRTRLRGMFGAGLEQKANAVQRKKLTSNEAADDAFALWDANRNADLRGLKRDDWIGQGDTPAAFIAWKSKQQVGYEFRHSPSETGGGPGRPPSIDLKVASAGVQDSHFIQHIPEFADSNALFGWFWRGGAEDLERKVRVKLQTPKASIQEIIAHEPAIQGALDKVKQHSIYVQNKAEIEGSALYQNKSELAQLEEQFVASVTELNFLDMFADELPKKLDTVSNAQDLKAVYQLFQAHEEKILVLQVPSTDSLGLKLNLLVTNVRSRVHKLFRESYNAALSRLKKSLTPSQPQEEETQNPTKKLKTEDDQ